MSKIHEIHSSLSLARRFLKKKNLNCDTFFELISTVIVLCDIINLLFLEIAPKM